MRQRFAAIGVALSLGAATVLVAAGPASATFSPTGFTSNDLSTWQTNGIAWAVASAGNTVFVGGTFTSIRPPGSPVGSNQQPALNFASFNAATGAPGSCKIGFKNSTNTATVRALNVSPDGKTLYAGGSFATVTYTVKGVAHTDSVASMVAIDIASCTRITTFHPAFPTFVRAIASNSTSVFVGGDFKSVNGLTRNRIAKFSTTGALNATWAPALDLPALALAIPPAINGVNDNRLIVGGDFTTVTPSGGTVPVASHAITLLRQDTGAVEHAFGSSFIMTNSVVKALTVAPDASAFYMGDEGTGPGVFDGRTGISLRPPYAQIWRDTCLGATQAVVDYKGVIYSGSHAHDCSSMKEYGNGRRQHLLAEPANPPASTPALPQPQLLGWYPDTNDGIGEKLGPRAMTVANSTTGDFLWVVGEFTIVNGKAQQGLTHFGTGPDKVAPTAPSLSVVSYRSGQVEVHFRAATDTDDGTLTYAVYRDSGTTPIWTGQVTSAWWRRPQTTVLDTQAAASHHTYSVTATDGTFTTSKGAATAGVTVAGVQPTYDNTINADNPALHWRLDEKAGSYAADSAISGATPVNNNGTYPFPSTTMTYNQPGALLNDAGNTAIGLVGTANLYSELRQPKPGASYSEEVWFKTTTTKGGKIIGFGDAPISLSASNDRQIMMLNNGHLQFGINSGGRKVITSPAAYNNGQWHYVVVTQSSAGMKLYVDKVLVASNAVKTAFNYPNGGYWRVGGDIVSGWPSAPTSPYFQGTIDEVAVYNTALSATQITNHWKGSGRT